MVAFTFNLAFYEFGDFTAAADTGSTTGYANGTTFTLDAAATSLVMNVQDDDGFPLGSPNNAFDDAFVDPGPSSQVLNSPITANGTTYPTGSVVELEFAFTTTGGDTFWVIRIAGQNVGISGPTLPVPGTTYTVNGNSDGVSTPIDTVPCFTKGTKIMTPDGEVSVEDLSVGDMVVTRDHGPQPIRWIANRTLDAADLAARPNLHPIRIKAGALGPDRPARDLVVSPQHRILLRSNIAVRMFDAAEILVPAKKLLDLDGVEVVTDATEVAYFHFICDHHEIIEAEGTPAETLFLGTETVKAIGEEAHQEIMAIFGDLLPEVQVFARPVPSGAQVRRLMERHQKNEKSVFADSL
ncbi:MAG: Hint domain-containing protein [Yoonia sp.]|uniref:Hint domain-containing protein n=1 Tax=Yoonia sp. TaxID=2212373 RepID=UPI003EF5DF02